MPEPDRLGRRELLAGALALGVLGPDALAMPARDLAASPAARGRAGGAGPRALCELARRVRGPVLRPSSPGFARAARIYNARFDGRRPDAVVAPRDTDDVRAIMRWADRYGVRLTVRCRGGGGGNCGIVTRFELRAHRVRSAAFFTASLPSAAEAVAAWQAWAPETDPRLTSVLTLGANGSAHSAGQYLGSEIRLRALLEPLRAAGASVRTGTRPTAPCSCAGPTAARRHARRSRPSRTTCAARCPAARARSCSPRSRKGAPCPASGPGS